MQVQFACGSFQSRNPQLDGQRAINFFAEQAPSKDAEAVVAAFGCPGLADWLDFGDGGPVRGHTIMNGVLYAVSAGNLYAVSANAVATLLNTGAPIDGGSLLVSMANNRYQVIVTTGTNGYCYQIGGLNQVLSAISVQGDTSITVVVVNGLIAIGDPLVIPLDNGGTFNATVTGMAGPVISFTPALPSQVTDGVSAITPNTTFCQITQSNDNGFYPAATVTYMDTYFVAERAGTNQVFYSKPLDGLTWPGSNYFSKESNPDGMVGVANIHETLIVMGERTIEQFQNTGSYPNTFQLIPGATVQRGVGAVRTIISEDNALFFLGNDLIFYRLNELQPIRVSTHTEEGAWTKYATVTDAECCITFWMGHKFLHVTFPTARATWALDLATGIWHERESWGAGNVSYGRWRGNTAVRCYGMMLVGDAFSGKLGVYTDDAFTEYGFTMRGLMTSPPLHKDRKRCFMSLFETYWQTGVGNANAPDPQVTLDWSDDGNQTWNAIARPASIGRINAFLQRTRWWRCGSFRTRTLRLQITDPVRRNLVGAYLDMTVGL